MPKIIAGNWKMNLSANEASTLVGMIVDQIPSVTQSTVVVFPQTLLVPPTVRLLKNSHVKTGVQTISEYDRGAYTGETSPSLVKQSGCEYTLIGHSERRILYFETDSVCVKKLKKALELNLNVIYCVGESEKEREENNQTAVIKKQLRYIFDTLQANPTDATVHIAYEPIWAIGTGKTATVDQAAEIHALIRNELNAALPQNVSSAMSILYGGSAKKSNAKELLSAPHIDGLLIGGASLTEEFIHIVNISENL